MDILIMEYFKII